VTCDEKSVHGRSVVVLMVAAALVGGSLFTDIDLVSASILAIPAVLIVLFAGRRREDETSDSNPDL
jgi:hypothetical protein